MAKVVKLSVNDIPPFTDREVEDFLKSHSNLALGEYSKEHPLTFNIVTSDGHGMLCQSSLVVIKSQVGQGKSKTVRLLAGSALGGGHQFGLDAAPGRVCVRIIDTEMPWQLVDDTYKVVYKMAPSPRKDNSFLSVTTTMPKADEKPLSSLEKERMLIDIITDDCTAVFGTDTRLLYFVDGVAQLVDDINDQDSTKKFVERWLAVVANKPVCVVFIIHENAGKTGADGKATGHLGSYLMKQAGEVYRTSRKGDIFTVTSNQSTDPNCKYRYGAQIPDINFRIEGAFADETYVPADAPADVRKENKSLAKYQALSSNVKASFKLLNRDTVTRTELESAYVGVSKVSVRTATRHITEALNVGMIEITSDNLYKWSGS